MKTFESTASMKLASLTAGQLIETKGYYTTGDGGGARYLIQTAVEFGGTPDEQGDHTLANGNIAVLQYSGFVSVRQFGAIGDGVTDDTIAINSALSATHSLTFDSTPANTYLVSDTILLGSNLHLTFDPEVTIKMAPSIAKPLVKNKDSSNENITIIGGIFDVDEANQTTQEHCIRFDNVHNSHFERMEIKPTHFVSGPTAAWHLQDCNENVLDQCTLKASAGEGLLIIGTDNIVSDGNYSDCQNGSGIQASGDGCVYSGNYCTNNAGSPISVHGDNVKVLNNTVVGGGFPGTNGINMGHSGDPVTNSVVSGNTVRGFIGANGIRCNAASNNVIISNNVVTGLTDAASYAIGVGDGSNDISIIGNRVENCIFGINISQTSAMISNNVVKDCTRLGITLFSSIGAVVSNNIVENNQDVGVQLDANSLRCVVEGNVIRSNTVGIVVAAPSAGHVISSNQIQENSIGPLSNPGGNELIGNLCSLTDELVSSFTMIASGVDITINNENILIGSRLSLVATSTGISARDIYIKSQTAGSAVVGNTGGAGGETFELHIK